MEKSLNIISVNISKAQLKLSERLFTLIKENDKHFSVIAWGEKKGNEIEYSSMQCDGSFMDHDLFLNSKISDSTDDFDTVLEGEFDTDSTSPWFPPSTILKKVIEGLKENITRSWESYSDPEEQLVENVFNYKSYYDAGEIDYGKHGPELINGQLYVSVYHFLEFNGYKPNQYNTNALGKLLSNNNSDITICKYKAHDFEIRKYNYQFLKEKEIEFEVFKR